ncbi:FRAS1-related extracellular matrix protein 1-like [Branchiostoma floridae x Branchiostoma japonicum]
MALLSWHQRTIANFEASHWQHVKASPTRSLQRRLTRLTTCIYDCVLLFNQGNKKRSGVNQRPCDSSTKGLLQYQSKQLYQCNGRRWQLWKPQEQPLTGGCQTGWTKYGSLCYRKGDSQETWNDAQLICRERHGAELPTILSSETSDWISTFVNREPVWIGLNDKGQQRRWKWPAGQSLSYTNWKPGQPDSDSDIQRNCVVMNQLQKWNVRKCHRGRNVYICAKQVGS